MVMKKLSIYYYYDYYKEEEKEGGKEKEEDGESVNEEVIKDEKEIYKKMENNARGEK